MKKTILPSNIPVLTDYRESNSLKVLGEGMSEEETPFSKRGLPRHRIFCRKRHRLPKSVCAGIVLAVVLRLSLAMAADLRVTPDVSVTDLGEAAATESAERVPEHARFIQKGAPISLVNSTLVDEERRAIQMIHPLDRESATEWLASFIANKPLNCPHKTQNAWIEAILDGVERNRIPLCREIVGLVAALVSIESSFRVDPLAVDASRGESLTRLLDRTEHEFMEKYGVLVNVPGVHHVYTTYRDKYYPKLAACHTEGEVDRVARSIAEDLARDAGSLPGMIQKVIHKELEKLVYIVRTKGSMQLNFTRAREVMKDRCEQFTDRELVDYMYTMHGGIDVGIAALKPMFVQYAACYGKPGDMSWLFFVGMDYHYGPFSSRNMMEQIRIRDLSGHKIAIDGDFLHYDDKGLPMDRESDTFKAITSLYPRMSRSRIMEALLLEKDRQYIYTDLHQAIISAHRERFGETPFAVIGDLWMGQSAQIKHGATWKTRSYLHKLDRYLNSLPWDHSLP